MNAVQYLIWEIWDKFYTNICGHFCKLERLMNPLEVSWMKEIKVMENGVISANRNNFGIAMV